MKSLNQILQEIKKNEGYENMTDETLVYFAAYNLYLDIKIMNKQTKSWKEFREELGYARV